MNPMKTITCSAATLLAFAVLSAPTSAQQDKSKRPSPPASADCTLAAGKTIHIDYSSPRMRGRKIYGGLVPWDKYWRAGANEATTFVTTADVTVGGKDVPAGPYTLFAIPNPDKWTLIVSKKTGEWGIPHPGEQVELTRAEMQVSKLDAPVEDFTISFDSSGGACTLRMDWETTRASIAIAAK
ncbi:MAG TPA: DUF2911 domain-containing protein [Candidatus Acidoferrales bacterium]|nr:DUF2911 domain-containing protein [Candidatus Acidoferrales bacterium]